MSRSFADLHTAAIGSPTFLGVIDATTTSKTNGQASAAFNTAGTGLAQKTLLIYAANACLVLPVASSTATVTTSNGVPLVAGEKAVITMLPGDTHLAVITASGTANLQVWELRS